MSTDETKSPSEAIYQVGDKVRVQLSDAPEFTATIAIVQPDGQMKIEWANGRWAWVAERRIVGRA